MTPSGVLCRIVGAKNLLSIGLLVREGRATQRTVANERWLSEPFYMAQCIRLSGRAATISPPRCDRGSLRSVSAGERHELPAAAARGGPRGLADRRAARRQGPVPIVLREHAHDPEALLESAHFTYK